MKTLIPENLRGKELFKFLIENKSKLVAEKKSALKKTDATISSTSIISPVKTSATKDMGEGVQDPETGIVDVKVVANTAWWCDSAMDVLTDKCYDKSVKEKGILIPHIHDHEWCSTGHVGDVKAVYTQTISLKDLGLKKAGSTTALIFETKIREDYNDDVYKFYKNGKINQHSIGLMYVSIGLCINDKDYLPEFELWNKYYDKVINQDVVDERGYFWIVPEIKIMENSCVLFGANELTPTLDAKTDTDNEPSEDTHEQPSHKSSIITVTDLFTFN
jgi:hypothetical protein